MCIKIQINPKIMFWEPGSVHISGSGLGLFPQLFSLTKDTDLRFPQVNQDDVKARQRYGDAGC